MSDHDELYLDDDEDEIIEGYCVRDRQMVELEHPQPVWTRRGMPATRGECPDCGGTVFRMGRTAAHDRLNQPAAKAVAGAQRMHLARNTTYIVFAEADEVIARTIAGDLEKSGVAAWLHDHDTPASEHWANGFHPALNECASMIVVLSPALYEASALSTTWAFFRDKRKPIVIAQIATAEAPDDIRRSPRYDFAHDYKAAFRQMLQTL